MRDNIIVVCTRKHEEIYAIEYIIEAIPLVIEENNNIRFIFIGEGPLTNKYLGIVKELGIESFTKFISWVSNEKLPMYLSNSDIYVSSSLSDGSSLCLLEALACGLPAVITDIKSNLEWIRNDYNGYLCQVKNSRIL